MPISIDNLKDVEGWKGGEGQLIPIGDHIARVAECEEDNPTSNNNPQVRVEWEVVDGPYRGATRREWVVITPSTLGKIKALLEALRFPIPEGNFTMPTSELVGKQAQIIVREDSYNNKPRVVAHNPVPTVTGGDVPIDTAGLPAVPAADESLPF